MGSQGGEPAERAACPTCGGALDTAVPGWCPSCSTGHRIAAQELVVWLVERADALPVEDADGDPLRWPDYAERRNEARDTTGTDESVVAVSGRIRGHDERAVLVVWEFGFLGGSMSAGAGRRIASAYDHARAAGLPIVLLPSTGGARMQEGMASLVQMGATSVAAAEHADAGLLQITVLRDPTTGGVFASHANLSDLVLAEPHATIGFAGPRVAEAMTGGPLPPGSHTSRGALASGLVDAIVPRPDLPATLARLLAWGAARPAAVPPRPGIEPERPDDPWREVERSRAEDRARSSAYLAALDVAGELRGDRAGSDDPTIRVVLAQVLGRPAVVIAMDRDAEGGRIGPSGYRKAWRGLALAERVGVPVVTLIDTPGADASAASEAGGIAHHIARTFTEVLAAATPVVSLVIGEGGSGGALALAVGDLLLIQEHAIFSVIAPEGAAAILHRDAGRAEEVAALLDPTAWRLQELGIADEIVHEPEGREVTTALEAVARSLDELSARDPAELGRSRRRRWRTAGQPGAVTEGAAP